MEFRDNEAIYLQIAGYVSENILLGKWAVEQRIPSVREIAVDLQVNPNTVVRAYELLQQQGVIANKRGIGFFANTDAVDKIKLFKKERFLKQDLPEFFKTVYLLNIDPQEIVERFESFKKQQYKP